MNKIIEVVFSPEAEKTYWQLSEGAGTSKIDAMLLKAIQQKIEFIKTDIHYGNPIAKKLIPEEYRIKYGITNLFRVELPNFWRMLYSLTNCETEIEIISFVLDIIDHKAYDKKFGYRKK